MTPHMDEYCSLSFLPATPSSWIIEGLFELTRRPLRAPNVDTLCYFGNYRGTSRSVACLAGGPMSRTADTNHDWGFIKNILVFTDPKVGQGMAYPLSRPSLLSLSPGRHWVYLPPSNGSGHKNMMSSSHKSSNGGGGSSKSGGGLLSAGKRSDRRMSVCTAALPSPELTMSQVWQILELFCFLF